MPYRMRWIFFFLNSVAGLNCHMQFIVGGDTKHKDKTEQSEAVTMNRWVALAKLVTTFFVSSFFSEYQAFLAL